MSIKEVARKRLIEDIIRPIRPATGWKVVILDHETTRILSSACRMYDVMEEGVTLVENISIARQPLPKMDAIYFLTPKEESINLLLRDFKDPKNPQYGAVHLFFSSRLSDELFAKIRANEPLKSRIKGLKEINMDFLVYESQVFHFDSPDTFKLLFSPECTTQAGGELKRMADKIVSVCATLNEYPFVRYHKDQRVSHSLATFVQEKLDQLNKENSAYASSISGKNRATLLILDRSEDMLAPLLHEFTYQAMIYDLLPVTNDHYKFVTTSGTGEQRGKEVILGESDPLWSTLRHMHIADTINWILDGFNEFVQENKASKFAQKERVNDLKEMSDAMKAMPQYQEMLNKYSLHINMSNECMRMFGQRSLAKIAALEQDMATGEDSEGRAVRNFLSNLPAILTDASVNLNDKLRLLMIYIISQEGIKATDKKRLMDLARISLQDQACITNLRFLGVTLLTGPNVKKGSAKDKKKNKKQRDDAPPYELSRYTPQIKVIGQELINNTLSSDEYPYVKGGKDVDEDVKSSTKEDIKSVRSQKTQPKWVKDKHKAEKLSANKPKLIIFIAGGMTYSEMRAAYELTTKNEDREVIIGSSNIIVPDEFVKNLRDLQKLDQVPDTEF